MENPYLSVLWGGVANALEALPYILAMIAIAMALTVLEAKFGRKKKRPWRRNGNWRGSGRNDARQYWSDERIGKPVDAADQLRTVMHAEFKARPLLNKSEARLFRAIDKMVTELAPAGWQVMAQVSLGEILRTGDKAAYSCINSKRVDLLLVDAECNPVHAIEYQGGGHSKGAHATAARDAVKKEALRRAGIGYVEVVPGDTPAELRRVVDYVEVAANARPPSCAGRWNGSGRRCAAELIGVASPKCTYVAGNQHPLTYF